MIITTTENISGKTVIQTLGMVTGNVVRARHVGSDLVAGLKSIVGGEVKGYTKLMNEVREQALERLKTEARALGADGIICVRLATSEVMQGVMELCVYGTAVKLQ